MLHAQDAPLTQPVSELAPEADYWRTRGTGTLALLAIVAGFIAIVRRQWALLAAAAAVFLAALVIGRAQPIDGGGIWGLRPAVAQPGAFVVDAVGSSGARPQNARWRPDPAALGRDAAYILAQEAYLNRSPAEVGRQLTAMGQDYPQPSRVTRARIDAMVLYARAHHIDHHGPRAAPRVVPLQVQRSISKALSIVTGLGVLGSLALDVLGAQLRRRGE